MRSLLIKLNILFLVLVANVLKAQEPRLHPAQIGAYGAAADAFLVSDGTVTTFKTAATLGVDMSATNEIQNLSFTGSASPFSLNISSGTGVTIAAGSNITLTRTANELTIAAANQLQTISASGSGSNYSIDLSSGGGSVGLIAGSNITISRTGNNLTISGTGSSDTYVTGATFTGGTLTLTGMAGGAVNVSLDGRYLQTEVDGSITNEGSLTVGAGSATTSLIQSNTSGSTNVTVEAQAGSGLVLSEPGSNTIRIAWADMIAEEFTPTSGNTITTTANIPTDLERISIYRNGIEQTVGAGKGVTNINTGTKVITFNRSFTSGETVRVVFIGGN